MTSISSIKRPPEPVGFRVDRFYTDGSRSLPETLSGGEFGWGGTSVK